MAMVQENWLALILITVISLLANWYFGNRGIRFGWVLLGIIAAIGLTVSCVELAWADVTTATLAYGILVIYCPLIWLVSENKDRNSDENKKSLLQQLH